LPSPASSPGVTGGGQRKPEPSTSTTKCRLCEVTRRHRGQVQLIRGTAPSRAAFGRRARVLKTEFWSRNLPRVELDQRSREARLQVERVFLPRVLRRQSRFRLWFFCWRAYCGAPQKSEQESCRLGTGYLRVCAVISILAGGHSIHLAPERAAPECDEMVAFGSSTARRGSAANICREFTKCRMFESGRRTSTAGRYLLFRVRWLLLKSGRARPPYNYASPILPMYPVRPIPT
jgi:hypothetical protein